MPTKKLTAELDKRFTVANKVLLQSFEEKALLIDLATESVYQLNKTGARVVGLVNEGHTIQELLNTLSEEYTASPKELEQDVFTLLSDLLARRLIVEKLA